MTYKTTDEIRDALLKFFKKDVFVKYGERSPYECTVAVLATKFNDTNPVVVSGVLKTLVQERKVLLFNYNNEPHFMLPDWKKFITRKERKLIK